MRPSARHDGCYDHDQHSEGGDENGDGQPAGPARCKEQGDPGKPGDRDPSFHDVTGHIGRGDDEADGGERGDTDDGEDQERIEMGQRQSDGGRGVSSADECVNDDEGRRAAEQSSDCKTDGKDERHA